MRKNRIATVVVAAALAALGTLAATPAAAPATPAPPPQPEKVTIQSLSAWYGAVTFTHAKHSDLVGDCAGCHHRSEGQAVACGTCHPSETDPSSPSTVTLKVAYHDRCVAWHKTAGSGPTDCAGCHALKTPPAAAGPNAQKP